MIARASRVAARSVARPHVRAMAGFTRATPPGSDANIPTDLDQQTGRRMTEIQFELDGHARGRRRLLALFFFSSRKRSTHVRSIS